MGVEQGKVFMFIKYFMYTKVYYIYDQVCQKTHGEQQNKMYIMLCCKVYRKLKKLSYKNNNIFFV